MGKGQIKRQPAKKKAAADANPAKRSVRNIVKRDRCAGGHAKCSEVKGALDV